MSLFIPFSSPTKNSPKKKATPPPPPLFIPGVLPLFFSEVVTFRLPLPLPQDCFSRREKAFCGRGKSVCGNDGDGEKRRKVFFHATTVRKGGCEREIGLLSWQAGFFFGVEGKHALRR